MNKTTLNLAESGRVNWVSSRVLGKQNFTTVLGLMVFWHFKPGAQKGIIRLAKLVDFEAACFSARCYMDHRKNRRSLAGLDGLDFWRARPADLYANQSTG